MTTTNYIPSHNQAYSHGIQWGEVSKGYDSIVVTSYKVLKLGLTLSQHCPAVCLICAVCGHTLNT